MLVYITSVIKSFLFENILILKIFVVSKNLLLRNTFHEHVFSKRYQITFAEFESRNINLGLGDEETKVWFILFPSRGSRKIRKRR